MNYYEEFGLPLDATIDEIRHAYKRMARLLHPDAQSDPTLKDLAECQMKRLGEIVDVLSDPYKRRLYDESLAGGPEMQAQRFPPVASRSIETLANWYSESRSAQLLRANGYWVLLGTTGLALAIGCFRVPPRQMAAVPPVSVRQSEPVGSEVAEMRVGEGDRPAITRPTTKRKSTVAPDSRETAEDALLPWPKTVHNEQFHAALPARVTGATAPVTAVPEVRGGAEGAPEPSTQVEAAVERSFRGRWLYVPDAGEAVEAGQYPATYVEFTIIEEGGSLVGEYRARFNVSDLAVSPEISFQARGPAASSATTLQWSSTIGARGKALLTLRAPNVMHVSWWTTEFGREPTLGSGTAVLIRQLGY